MNQKSTDTKCHLDALYGDSKFRAISTGTRDHFRVFERKSATEESPVGMILYACGRWIRVHNDFAFNYGCLSLDDAVENFDGLTRL